nr:MAG TPA: hypothetical protein [Caudoviricetes sp.]DAN66248.1 MAG TPA: hypothetical protein [Caudoviricetes sp.]
MEVSPVERTSFCNSLNRIENIMGRCDCCSRFDKSTL